MQFVKSHPSALWTKTILGDLKHLDGKRVKKKHSASKRAAPEPVDKDYLLEAYETSRSMGLSLEGRRVFIFDYGGTLLHKEKHTIYIKHTLSAISGRKPEKSVMDPQRMCDLDWWLCMHVGGCVLGAGMRKLLSSAISRTARRSCMWKMRVFCVSAVRE